MTKTACLVLALAHMAPSQKCARAVDSLGFYIKSSKTESALRTEIINDGSIRIPDFKSFLEAECVKKLAESREYDEDLAVNFKVDESEFLRKTNRIIDHYETLGFPLPDGLDQFVEEKREANRKILPLLKIQRKRSALEWEISRRLFGHDWFEIRAPEIAIQMYQQSLLDETISLGGFSCRYMVDDKLKTISFPVSLYTLSQLLNLSNGASSRPIKIEADNYSWEESKKVVVQICRASIGLLELRIVKTSL